MKLTIKSTGNSPDHYTFDGDTITAHSGDVSESFDLSALGSDDKFQGVEPETLDMNPAHIIRDAYRDDSGELHVTLCQAVGPGHWGKSDKFDSSEYDPDAIHVPFNGAAAGAPWALTRQGKKEPNDG
jgi:hypothetical protein